MTDLQHLEVPHTGGKMERSVQLVIGGLQVGPGSDEGPGHLRISSQGSAVEGGVTTAILYLYRTQVRVGRETFLFL